MESQNGTPLVTVVCTTYNQEDYIEDALKGFLSQQTSFPFEIIVHDDASTDSTPDIIKAYAREYPSIVKPIFQQVNQYSKGGMIVRDCILPRCRGKYIASCEGDDYWCDPSKLQKQIDFLESHPECPACAHNTWLLDCRNGQKRIMSKVKATGMIPMDLLLSAGGSYHTSSLVRRRSTYDSQPDFLRGTHGVGDYPLRVFFALSGGVHFINLQMSVYRYRAKGSWSERNHNDRHAAIETHKALINMLLKADRYSDEKYHDLFLDAIKEQEFMNFDLARDYRSMLRNAYRKQFHSCSKKKQLRIFLSAMCPALGNALDR